MRGVAGNDVHIVEKNDRPLRVRARVRPGRVLENLDSMPS
jgi:hypothetical protein